MMEGIAVSGLEKRLIADDCEKVKVGMPSWWREICYYILRFMICCFIEANRAQISFTTASSFLNAWKNWSRGSFVYHIYKKHRNSCRRQQVIDTRLGMINAVETEKTKCWGVNLMIFMMFKRSKVQRSVMLSVLESLIKWRWWKPASQRSDLFNDAFDNAANFYLPISRERDVGYNRDRPENIEIEKL